MHILLSMGQLLVASVNRVDGGMISSRKQSPGVGVRQLSRLTQFWNLKTMTSYVLSAYVRTGVPWRSPPAFGAQLAYKQKPFESWQFSLERKHILNNVRLRLQLIKDRRFFSHVNCVCNFDPIWKTHVSARVLIIYSYIPCKHIYKYLSMM